MPNAPSAADTRMFLLPGGLALVIVLFGGIMAGVGYYRARRDQASLSWPTTPALIASALQGNYRATGISPTVTHSMVTFQYQVGGKQYEFRSNSSAGGSAGSVIQLRYDPEDPSDTRFPDQELFPATLFYLIGLASVLLSLPFWYLAVRWFASAPLPS